MKWLFGDITTYLLGGYASSSAASMVEVMVSGCSILEHALPSLHHLLPHLWPVATASRWGVEFELHGPVATASGSPSQFELHGPVATASGSPTNTSAATGRRRMVIWSYDQVCICHKFWTFLPWSQILNCCFTRRLAGQRNDFFSHDIDYYPIFFREVTGVEEVDDGWRVDTTIGMGSWKCSTGVQLVFHYWNASF